MKGFASDSYARKRLFSDCRRHRKVPPVRLGRHYFDFCMEFTGLHLAARNGLLIGLNLLFDCYKSEEREPFQSEHDD